MWEIWQTVTQINSLTAADELGLFSLLAPQPLTVAAIAERLAVQPRAAVAITGYMAALGFLDCDETRRYGLTALARKYMLPDSDYYWGPVWQCTRNAPASADMFVEALQKNNSTIHDGNPLFEFLSSNKDFAREFAYSMHSRGLYSAEQVAKSVLFNGVTRLLDIGGGIGTFATQIVTNHAAMTAQVIDLPMVCELGEEYAASRGLQQRVSFRALDFFNEAWPTDADGMFFSDIFHDWNFDTCREIADKAFTALRRGGRIFICELLKDDDRCGPWLANSYDMAMIIHTEGQQFTFAELRAIVEGAGFTGVVKEPAGDVFTLVSATKP
ncbi:methyltransferase [Exilibacterium tricleocarpae]|nr:methyltransferase [Exilibacterium tricleocarpae]